MKNLARVDTRKKRAAGATKTDLATVKGKIVEFAWWLKKQGRSEKTIQNYTAMLRLLVKADCDLMDPETVKEVLALSNKSNSWKCLAIAAYTALLKMEGGRWEPPVCKVTRKLPFIPTEQEIDALIASCGQKTAAFLQLLKETAMRAGEANGLLWIDVDLERHIITLNKPEKFGNPRIFKISDKLARMLGALPRKDEHVFGNSSVQGKKATFNYSRKRAAEKLGNPRLLRVHFHTFRHWKATMEYHKTKDILHVKELLGHRSIETTMLYIQLDKALFQETSSEFHFATAKTIKEAGKIIEVGFEYVCTHEGTMLFRKRK